MRESGRRLAEIFSQIPAFLKRGMREIDLAAEMEYHLRKGCSEGALRLRSFGQEIIGLSSSGARAAYPGLRTDLSRARGFQVPRPTARQPASSKKTFRSSSTTLAPLTGT